jgi:hypothetical protein
MRTKPIFFLIPLLVLLSAVTTVAALERQRAPDWQTTLDHYLARRQRAGTALRVQRVVFAQQPWRFDAALASAAPDPEDWRWNAERLPYPPDAVYCVLFENVAGSTAKAAATTGGQVVYVAHHSDKLWRVGWIVHEGPREPFPPALRADLSALGCDLSLP